MKTITKIFINLVKKIPLFSELFLFIGLFLIRLPPLYLLPLENPLFTSHSVARYFIIIMFTSTIIYSYFYDKKISFPQGLTLLIIIYFFSQSASIIQAIHIDVFWIEYKNIVFSLMIFYSAFNLANKQNIKILVWIFIITGFINLIFEYITYFFPQVIYTYIQPFLYDKYWELFNFHFQRQRFFPEIFDEILIPLLFYFSYVQQNQIKKIFNIVNVIGIVIFSLLSNWRIRLVMIIFSFIISLKIYWKTSKKLSITISSLTLFFLVFGYIVSTKVIGFNSFDRFFFPSKEDVTNITGRLEFFNESVYVTSYSPLFGVGLGQYDDYVPEIAKIPYIMSNKISTINLQIGYYPHNIFFNTLATSGILGLFSYTGLILYFLLGDLSNIKKRPLLFKSFIIVFWTLFLLSNTTPTNYFSYLITFWFLRAVIEKMKIIYTNK